MMHRLLQFRSSKLLCAASTLNNRTANYQNFVMSDALVQIEKDCQKYCPVPRFPNQKVTVVGAGSDVGRVAALFLKQHNVIKILALYDDAPERRVIGVANDLAHIDTSTEVEAFQGRVFLKDALHNTDVVLICGGEYAKPPCCNMLERDLFFYNMQLVRTVSIAVAHFCPHAVLAIQTPPVDCNFALAMHTLKLNGAYDKRRLLGINSINAMRANQLFCSITGSDPTGASTPVVCGTGRCTRVPVLSIAKAGNIPQSQVECITRLVREADEIICKVKSNNEQGHLSIGFSTARTIVNIMTGLFVKSTMVDSALVEQNDPDKCYGMPICATPVTMGRHGIEQYMVPQLNEAEMRLVKNSKCDLEDMLHLGRCYALGDEYELPSCKVPCYCCPRDCPAPCKSKPDK